jgi:uncharacterized protein (TIGR03032 family)
LALADWLRRQCLSLAFTTYRANRLFFLGVGGEGELCLHERLFDRPMGLFAQDDALWMATRRQIWRLDNLLAPGQLHEGADRLYVPAASFTTGDVNAHELVVDAGGEPVFVNTAFNCLAGLRPGCSFAPLWQPSFISRLVPHDCCHLNGIALQEGILSWATACGQRGEAASWREQRVGGGVLLHLPTNAIAATGLTMPHSPRWHASKVWLLNSGSGELGWIEGERFNPLCFLPGFARDLAFAGGCAVVGISTLRSPQFTGLPLEHRLKAAGLAGGRCGLRVIDLATGAMLHSLDLPDPIDELFDVVLLPGACQPRALGLLAEDIDCLVKIPGRDELMTVRPRAPAARPREESKLWEFGLPSPSSSSGVASGHTEPCIADGWASMPAPAAPLRYQRVFQLTPATLTPYAALTFPSLASGSAALAGIRGELLGLSAMASGVMVGLAVAERQPDGSASLRSLMVDPAWRRRGIGSRLVGELMIFLASEGIRPFRLRYRASELTATALEPILARLGWSDPRTDFILIESRAERLAAAPWADRFPIRAPYRLQPWLEFASTTPATSIQYEARLLEVPETLLPPIGLEGIDPVVSLALRHHEGLVGWLIAHRSGAGRLRYSSLFVSPSHRGSARGLALLASGFRRQQASGLPFARAAIAADNDQMLRVLRRHLAPFLTGEGESRCSEHPLVPQATTSGPPASADD